MTYFSIIALYFINIELSTKNKIISTKLNKAYYLITIGTIFNYSASVLWNKPHFIINIIAFSSSILLSIGLIYLLKVFNLKLFNQTKFINKIVNFALSLFVLKTLLQILQSFPLFANISYSLKSQFIIGYIHLVTLGVITTSIFGLILIKRLFKQSKLMIWGVVIFLFGFIFTEIILFGQGLFLWIDISIFTQYYNQYMLISSTFLFLGILITYIGLKK